MDNTFEDTTNDEAKDIERSIITTPCDASVG